MNNNTILIDRYFQNELSIEEKLEFENRLNDDAELKEDMLIHKKIVEAIISAPAKEGFTKAIKKQKLTKKLLRWGIIIAVISILAFIHHHFKSHF